MNYFRNMNRNSKIIVACVCAVLVIALLATACGMEAEKVEPTITEGITVETIEPVSISTKTTSADYVDFTEDYKVSLGEFTLTAYCPCVECCGIWGENRPLDEYGDIIVYTASGEQAVEGVTVAADLPFGSVLYINGHQYIVQDSGADIKDKRIDIYFDHHQDALNFGVQTAEVFIDKRR